MAEDKQYNDSISLKSYFKDLKKIELINSDEQTKLAVKAKGGDKKSMNTLVESNLRFVCSIAKEYIYTGIPLEDLIQEGNFGIIKAVEKFDEKRGFRFISYAVWWIRQSILQSVYETSSSVRLPVNRINAINKVSKASDVLIKKNGREPTINEISDFYFNKEIGKSDLSDKDIKNVYMDSSSEVSLNSTVSEEYGIELHESIEGEGFNDMEINMNNKSLQYELNEVLNALSDRECIILKMYFGIGDYETMTLSEIGEKINLTNERVRQIKEFSLKKLRTYNNSSKLKEFLSCEMK